MMTLMLTGVPTATVHVHCVRYLKVLHSRVFYPIKTIRTKQNLVGSVSSLLHVPYIGNTIATVWKVGTQRLTTINSKVCDMMVDYFILSKPFMFMSMFIQVTGKQYVTNWATLKIWSELLKGIRIIRASWDVFHENFPRLRKCFLHNSRWSERAITLWASQFHISNTWK